MVALNVMRWGDLAEAVPMSPDVLLGHSFGGTLAQIGVLNGMFTPGALILEDPVSVFADQETPRAMLDQDEVNLPTTIDGLLAANPGQTAFVDIVERLAEGEWFK